MPRGPHPCWLAGEALVLSPRPTPLWGARSVASSRPPASRAACAQGARGGVVRLEGWAPRASGASPWLACRQGPFAGASLGPRSSPVQRPLRARWGRPGAARGLGCCGFGKRRAASLPAPADSFSARTGLLLPPPFVLWPGGGRQRWRVEFHFFPLFSLLQETASDDAGGRHRSPPRGSGRAGEFPGGRRAPGRPGTPSLHGGRPLRRVRASPGLVPAGELDAPGCAPYTETTSGDGGGEGGSRHATGRASPSRTRWPRLSSIPLHVPFPVGRHVLSASPTLRPSLGLRSEWLSRQQPLATVDSSCFASVPLRAMTLSLDYFCLFRRADLDTLGLSAGPEGEAARGGEKATLVTSG